MPSRRVSISHTAPLSELRKMNSSSWVLAPDSKRPAAEVYAPPSGAVSRTASRGVDAAAACARARALAKAIPRRRWRICAAANVRPWSAATDWIVARSCWATESGRA